jgi:hypothetical protein
MNREKVKGFIKHSLPFWAALFIVLWIGRSGCQPEIRDSQNTNHIKTEIKNNEQKRDSAKKEVSKTEVKQTEVKKAYRQRLSDLGPTTTPCRDTIFQIVQLCDTVIFVDSVLIGQLKQVIKLDSATIHLQQNVIRGDSLTIIDLTKLVQKERNKKKFWKTVTVIGAGLAAGIILTK